MKTPKNYPAIVYKYRGWTDKYQKAPLIKSQLYLSSPSDFNDPFDCRIPPNFISMSEEEIKSYIDNFIKRHGDGLKKEGLDLKHEYDFMINRLTNEREDVQEQYNESSFKDYDMHLGVLSMSSIWDSILMWSHYADRHKGYCIGFDEEKMRKSGLFNSGGPVSYPDDENYPLISPLRDRETEGFFTATYNKAFNWKYEKEYRFTKLSFPEPLHKEDRLVEVPSEYVLEVIIGLRTERKTIEEICDVCFSRNIPVYQLMQVPFQYKVKRELIKK